MAIIKYITGLDLGQANDFTALAVLELTVQPDVDKPERKVRHYAVRHLQRFALGTAYPAICTRVREIFAGRPLAGSTLAVDQTGVGRPVVDMLRRVKVYARIQPITITGGHKANPGEGGWLVPKKELVSTLQVLLQSRRLKIAPSLQDAKTLVKELLDFKVKITAAANETFGNFREGTHDDLVLAIAIAAWEGERGPVETCRPRVLYCPLVPNPNTLA